MGWVGLEGERGISLLPEGRGSPRRASQPPPLCRHSPAAALPKPGSPHDRPMRRAKSRRGPCEPVLRGNQLKQRVGVVGSRRDPHDRAERSPRLLPGAQADNQLLSRCGDLGNLIGAGASECPVRDPEGSTRQKAEFGSVPPSECQYPGGEFPREAEDSGTRAGP